MKRHQVFCGLECKYAANRNGAWYLIENGRSVSTDTMVRDLAAEYFPHGHTIYEAKGRWMQEGRIYTEPTLIVEVWEVEGFDKQPVGRFAGAYKDRAQQESVVILTQEADATVI